MLVSRKRNEQGLCKKAARIQFSNKALPRDCIVTGVSDKGIRLVIIEPASIPQNFFITLATRARQCKLTWQIGYELGAEFVD